MHFLIFENAMSKKIAPGIFRFVSMLCFNIWKSNEQKHCARNFEIRKYAFSNIWKSDEQKVAPVIFRFVCFFLNIWKSDEQKHCARSFETRKYAFFDIWKSDEETIAPGIYRFVSMLCCNIWKSDEQKKRARNLRFISMLSLIFEKGMSKNIYPQIFVGVGKNFRVCRNAFIYLKVTSKKKCTRTVCL